MLTLKRTLKSLVLKARSWSHYIKYYKYYTRLCDLDKVDENRIAFVGHECSYTGAPVLLLNIIKRISENGFDVVLFVKIPGPLVKEYSKYSKVLWIRNENSDAFFKALQEISKRHRSVPKVLINSIVSGGFSKPFKNAGYRVVSLVHEMKQVVYDWGVVDECKTASIYCDELIFPSKVVQESFNDIVEFDYKYKIKAQGLYNKNIIEGTKLEARIKMLECFNNANPIIINVATGTFRKGIDIFLDIVELMPCYNFVWVGDIEKQYQIRAEELAKNKKNLYLPGYVNCMEKLFEIYRSASIFLLTSREEPFGSVVLESFSAGTPVIAFKNGGGFVDILKKDYTGKLADKLEASSFISEINELFGMKDYESFFENNCILESKKHDFNEYINFIMYALECK